VFFEKSSLGANVLLLIRPENAEIDCHGMEINGSWAEKRVKEPARKEAN
jgi:hypothetical protein